MTTMPAAAGRKPLHTRSITCDAYERDDGLIDLEARLQDTKPLPITLLDQRVVGPGQPIHQMRLRLTVDRDRWIVAAGAFSEHFPYPECEGAEASYQRLVGLRIEPGFTRRVKQLFGGAIGCTHMSELIPVMATVIYQVIWGDSEFDHHEASRATASSTPLGGCHGLRLDGQVVRTYFPQARSQGSKK